MFVIGLTGGIGAGKSEVARTLQDLGAVLINADAIGHETYRPGTQGWREVVEAFGEQVLQPSGLIDRKRLGSIVFNDPQAMARLNAIVHPKMRQAMERRLQELEQSGTQVAVLEAAILIEAGWTSLVDEVWSVEAPEPVVAERLARRNGLTREEVRRRIAAQISAAERASKAQVVIENSGTVEELRAKVRRLWDTRVKGRITQQ